MSKLTSVTETTRSTNQVVYSDIAAAFTPNAVTGDISKKTNVEAVKQSVKFLLLTTPGERLFQPDIGGGLNRLLFENMTPSLQYQLNKQIKATLENYEPRVEFIDAAINFDYDRNGANITVAFRVLKYNEDVTLTTWVERTR